MGLIFFLDLDAMLWRERVLSITIGALASSQQEASKSYTDNSKPHENQRPGHLKLFIDDRATLVI